MINIGENRPIVYAIFRLLILHPELHEEYNFNADYFKVNTANFQDELDVLYIRCRKMIQSTNNKIEYTSQFLESCYFEYADGTTKSAYQEYLKGISGASYLNEIRSRIEILRSIYETSMRMGNSVSEDFLIEQLKNLVISSSLIHQYLEISTLYAAKANDDEVSPQEFLDDYNAVLSRNEKLYSLPSVSKSERYSLFDKRLRIKVVDEVYDSSIYHLNQTLVGGFHKQTMTAFMTKTGGGKSTFMITLATEALKKGYNVAYINLEMENHYVVANIYSAISSKYDYNTILNNLTDDDMIDDIQKECDTLGIGQFTLISDRGSDKLADIKWMSEQIKKDEKRVRRETGNDDFVYDLVFIDYLYLLQPTHNLHRNSRSDELYRQVTVEAHKYAQEENKAVITVFQGNRGAETKLSENKQITLSDVGDSYASMRDIEYIYAISRYRNEIENKDGIIVSALKSRHYDGDLISFFIRYNSKSRSYNCKYSELYEYPLEEVDVKNKGRKLKYDITAEDVLLSNPDLHNKVPNGSLQIVLPKCEVSLCSKRYIDEIYQQHGWKTLTKDDFPEMNYDDAHRWIEEAVQIAKDIKANKQTTNSKVIISDNPDDLFRI